LFFVSIFFPTTPSPCINGYTGYVEFSLSILLLVRLGQNEHPKSLLFSKTSDHVSELTCNKITVYPRELYIAKAAENCGFSLVVPIISRTPTKDISPPYVKSGTTLDIKKEPLITQKPFLLVRSHKQNIYSFYFLFHIQLYIHYLRNFSSIFLSLSSNGIRFSYTTGSKRISFCNLCIAKSKSSSFATSSCFTSSSISSRLLNI